MRARTNTPPDADNPDASPDALLTLYGERVYRFCLRLCGGHAVEAEDLAQDVFVLAWQHRESFSGRAARTTWLMRIALNRYLRLRKKEAAQAPTVALNEDRDGAAASAAVADVASQTLSRLELARALDLLPPRQRAAFLLVKVEGLKYREAAATLGVPQGTVQSDVHLATLRLRSALATETDAPAHPSPSSIASSRPSQTAKEILTRVL